jgi:hypothetical protein
MGFRSGLASAKLTLFPGSSATSRTTDGEYLCWAEFSLGEAFFLPDRADRAFEGAALARATVVVL